MRHIHKLRWTTVPWWTGRDLNPRPYGAGLVPSRKQGPIAGPAKRAIFGMTLSVYHADLPAHRKTRTSQRLLNWFAPGSVQIDSSFTPALLFANQPSRSATPPTKN